VLAVNPPAALKESTMEEHEQSDIKTALTTGKALVLAVAQAVVLKGSVTVRDGRTQTSYGPGLGLEGTRTITAHRLDVVEQVDLGYHSDYDGWQTDLRERTYCEVDLAVSNEDGTTTLTVRYDGTGLAALAACVELAGTELA
jgi:hypothetical protein